MLQKKSVVAWVILTILTFGIGGLFWMAELTRDAGVLKKDKNYRTGSTVVILTILTFGIYGLYWHYVTARDIYAAEPGKEDNSLFNLLFALVGWSIISSILMQVRVNEIIDKRAAKKKA